MKNSESRITIGAGAAVLFVLLAGVGGNLKGKADALAAAEVREHPAHSPDTAEAGGGKARAPSQDPRRLEKIHKKLLDIWKSSTATSNDPELRAQTMQLLAQMSSPEIEAFLRSLPSGSERMGVDFLMVRRVLRGWVLQDGPAALAYLDTCGSARSSMTRMMITDMIMNWVRDQPDAALAWMSEQSLAPLQQARVANIRLNSLMVLVESDPDRAFQELSSMKGKDVSEQLKNWGGTNGRNPELRKRLLDYAAGTGNPGDLPAVRTAIINAIADEDPEAAKEFVRNLQASGRELTALDTALTTATARKNPESAYTDWLQKNSKVTEIPTEIRYGISAWLGRSSMGDHDDGEPIKWLDALPAGGQRDILYESTIPALAGFHRFPVLARQRPERAAHAVAAGGLAEGCGVEGRPACRRSGAAEEIAASINLSIHRLSFPRWVILDFTNNVTMGPDEALDRAQLALPATHR